MSLGSGLSITSVAGNCGKLLLIKLNSHLTNLTRNHRYSDALHLFHHIHSSHLIRPDHYTLSAAITACANSRDAAVGSQLHAYAIGAGLTVFHHVANTLLSLYSKSLDLRSVKLVFDEIDNPDVYSWTTLLSACTKLGDISYACHVFDQMPHRSVAIWNALITGCADNGCDELALNLFIKMHSSGVRHDNYSLASVLSLCSPELLDFGVQLHSLIIKTGLLARASVLNSLLTMYFTCQRVDDAFGVFEEGGDFEFDQITYNAMIAGLVGMERDRDAFLMFKNMQNAGLWPTNLTFVSIMGSCSCSMEAIQVHAQAVKMGFEDSTSPDEFTIGSLLVGSEGLEVVEIILAAVTKSGLVLKVEVSNALLSAFSRHGCIDKAFQLFSHMNCRNFISWNTLIYGYHLNGLPMEGLRQFSQLVMSGIIPNTSTLCIALNICAGTSALRHGKQVHNYICKMGYSYETSLNNALITLYAKCGILDWSSRVFQKMTTKDTITWNSMISAYKQHGEGWEAVRCFEMMQRCKVRPDVATFTAVLSACSHSGLVSDGCRIFSSMVSTYGIEPDLDHFSCIIDLLGRAGFLDETETLISGLHIEIDSSVWWTLFSSCAAHGNLRLGRIVAGILLETEQHDPSIYVLLSNIYADAGEWKESANVRELMKKCRVLKQPGSSWIRS
ncbi:OLC1v1011399C1 [Oldenlandia corymbosa var. corymbosa]|uniref:OLC1v1011399C1 n=1 Tax=Oldenlandia corymbosa var. corymbosa TaxID=529605 RepID=A0AAV1DVW6_OLDCO|nr:OLC1v1011399C1 [Oldenlandia corymbosa var. corymbosa]